MSATIKITIERFETSMTPVHKMRAVGIAADGKASYDYATADEMTTTKTEIYSQLIDDRKFNLPAVIMAFNGIPETVGKLEINRLECPHNAFVRTWGADDPAGSYEKCVACGLLRPVNAG